MEGKISSTSDLATSGLAKISDTEYKYITT